MAETQNADRDLRVFEKSGLKWVNVVKPSQQTLADLKAMFPFLLDIDLRDCLPPYQRPKLLDRERYLFVVLLFPIFDPKTRTIRASELDLFLGKDLVVSSHGGELKALVELAECYEGRSKTCVIEELKAPAFWLHSVLNALLAGCFPMLTHIANDINDLESELFRDANGRTVKEILRVKSNIVDMRKIMQGHKHVIEKFMSVAPRILDMKDLDVYYEDLVGHTKEIWDFLENDKNTIDAFYESYLSLVTYDTSVATKTLTALAFIIFPMTLMAAIWSMRAEHMPFLGLPGDFWFMLGTVFLVMTVTVGFLRRRKWL